MTNELNIELLNRKSEEYFYKVKRTFTGINAGDYLDKEDFLNFAYDCNQQISELEAEITRLKEWQEKAIDRVIDLEHENARLKEGRIIID